MILAARAILVDARTWVDGGGLWIERGIVHRVLRSRRAVLRLRGSRALELDGLVITPGLVDAHAHLDLGAVRARLPGRRGFVPWIRALIRARTGLTRRDLERAVHAGARVLLESGTTAIGDIDASGTSARLAPGLGARMLVYREVLDAWDPARTAASLRGVRARMPARLCVREGLSPHAPYTTS